AGTGLYALLPEDAELKHWFHLPTWAGPDVVGLWRPLAARLLAELRRAGSPTAEVQQQKAELTRLRDDLRSTRAQLREAKRGESAAAEELARLWRPADLPGGYHARQPVWYARRQAGVVAACVGEVRGDGPNRRYSLTVKGQVIRSNAEASQLRPRADPTPRPHKRSQAAADNVYSPTYSPQDPFYNSDPYA
ncbi:unnamed protein product, partial [Polarella glacialis]